MVETMEAEVGTDRRQFVFDANYVTLHDFPDRSIRDALTNAGNLRDLLHHAR